MMEKMNADMDKKIVDAIFTARKKQKEAQSTLSLMMEGVNGSEYEKQEFYLPDLLNAMDIYVSTSLSDAGIAASTAEAMACGLTCVVSDVYDNHEWIAHGENGFLFECGNAQNLSDTIISILDSSESELSVVRKGARKKILDDNDIYREMKKMEGLVHQLIEKT